MNVEYELFLPALKNEQVPWDRELTLQDWLALFDMANRHRVLPMIYEVIYDCPAAQKQDPRFFVPFKQQAIRGVMLQTIKTNEFLQILQEMRQAGLQPLVIKGIVCRSLYPHPDHRTSGDEDVLIPPGQFDACHRTLKKHGLHPVDPAQDIPFRLRSFLPQGGQPHLYRAAQVAVPARIRCLRRHEPLFCRGQQPGRYADHRRKRDPHHVQHGSPVLPDLPCIQAFSAQRLRHPAGM